MKLGEWLELTGNSQEKFAKKVGASQKTVYNWVHKLREPSLRMAHIILAETNCKVGFQDLLTEDLPKEVKEFLKKNRGKGR